MNFIVPHSQEESQHFQTFTDLSQIYAGIEGELCSKQSTLMNKLKNKFSDLYSGLLPSHYVIVNHIFSLQDNAMPTQITKSKLSMATQNGVILLVKQTYLGQKIFINGISSQELMYECKGTFSAEDNQNLNSEEKLIAKNIQETILLANDALSLSKLHGATIYLHTTISEKVSYFKQKILLAIFFGILIANEQLQELSITQIYQKLAESKIFSPAFLQIQFHPYEKGEILLTQLNPKSEQFQDNEIHMESFEIRQKQKFLFFDLNLNHKQLESLNRKSMSQNYLESQKPLSDQLRIGQLSISEYIKETKNQISQDSAFKEYLKDTQIDEQIKKEVKQALEAMGKSQAECIFTEGHLIFCLQPHQIHQKIRVLRKILNERLNPNPEIITQRFDPTKRIDKIIFSSSPSLGIAIFNPEHEIWFK